MLIRISAYRDNKARLFLYIHMHVRFFLFSSVHGMAYIYRYRYCTILPSRKNGNAMISLSIEIALVTKIAENHIRTSVKSESILFLSHVLNDVLGLCVNECKILLTAQYQIESVFCCFIAIRMNE